MKHLFMEIPGHTTTDNNRHQLEIKEKKEKTIFEQTLSIFSVN